MDTKPNFICIGAAKAGTTWLYKRLADHPNIWLPPIKELHYFNHQHITRFISLITKNTVMGRHSRSALFHGIKRNNILWTFIYLFKARTQKNYHKLFFNKAQKISGEITPSYARLPEDMVKNIAANNPNCKIIYILRNPIDRIWSHANMIKFIKKVLNKYQMSKYIKV